MVSVSFQARRRHRSAAGAAAAAALAAWLLLGLAPVGGSASGGGDAGRPAALLAPPPQALPEWEPGPGLPPDAEKALRRYRADQRRSVERALGLLDARFEGFRQGGEGFARDLTSWGTRARLAWRSAGAWVGMQASDAPERLVRERFATRVATPEMIEAAVRESAERLELELNADRVRALSRIRGRLPGSGRTAEEERLGWDVDSARDAWADMDRSSRGAGRSSMMMAMGSLAASTVAGEAAAVVAGSAALAAGGAAAGAAGAGAAGGSVVPVVRTAVGFAAGLTVGAAVDWWMTGSLERGIRASIDAGLEQTRRHLVDGRGEWMGLRSMYAARAAQDAERMERLLRRAAEGGRR